MREETANPAVRSGTNRVNVTMLAGNDDVDLGTGTARERQARHLLKIYAVSLPVALVLAEHAFGSGRRA